MMNDDLLAADAAIRRDPDMAHAVTLLVAHRGDIVFERHYRGSGPADLHTIHSVTKSVTSTLVGILVDDGLLSLDAPVRVPDRRSCFRRSRQEADHRAAPADDELGALWGRVVGHRRAREARRADTGGSARSSVGGDARMGLPLQQRCLARALGGDRGRRRAARRRPGGERGCLRRWGSTDGCGRATRKAANGAAEA